MIGLIVFIYAFCLLFIFSFSISQLYLTFYAKKYKHNVSEQNTLDVYPTVCIQLPVYNEQNVIVSLLQCIDKINYHKEKITIQVLDDSTDETSNLVQSFIASKPNHHFEHIQRKNRKGFKAGALAYGLTLTDAEYVAIFDADFQPSSDFLIQTLQYFKNEKIGLVQARWTFINQDFSFLTQLQAFGLHAHFNIEQQARNASSSFINFNGTCGVWRRKTIEDAGGWQDDTLTEDLDLSYRAQLKGWKFMYLHHLPVPSELPVQLQAVRNQQFRWNKGGAETAKKIMLKVWTSNISLRTKMLASFHLLNSSIFLFLMVAALLSVPMLMIKQNYASLQTFFLAGTFLFIGFFSIVYFYYRSEVVNNKTKFISFLFRFFSFISMNMAMSFYNGLAVFKGWIGQKSEFVRTPKLNHFNHYIELKKRKYFLYRPWRHVIIELILLLYFSFGIYVGIQIADGGLFFFHGLLCLGFILLIYQGIKHG